MLHDATIEVTCDGKGCYEATDVPLPYVYKDYSGKNGYYYDDDEEKIEKYLRDARDWVVRDGMHYCCKRCAG